MIESHDTSGVYGAAQYEKLSEAVKEAMACFIGLAMAPRDNVGPGSSYGMKHDFERATGIYVNNDVFKGAMLAAGYEPVNRDDLNWTFRVRPLASDRQEGYGPYPLPEGNQEGVKRLARLIDRAKERAAYDE